MSGNKVSTKTKGKEDKAKGSKCVNTPNEDSKDVDFTMLRKPIPTSITGFAQARKIFDLATEELKSLLTHECDLLYECKVCRNIFRSLANFISHKRIYCKEKFSSTEHSEFIKATSIASELSKIKRIERGYQEFVNRNEQLDVIDEEDERIPMTKDLTDIVERLTKTKGYQRHEDDCHQVSLQKIPNSSVAVFQNMKDVTEKEIDKMRSQVNEIDHILSRDRAVLQRDGKFAIVSSMDNSTASDTVIQISDDDDDEEQTLKCKICELQFSTQKTLKFHMKYKHVESRLVYPCPDCLEIFSTSWSVYRHLFKVHRKTAAQIRRLRESIQAKAFKMNNPPAFYEKRKNIKLAVPQKMSEEERIDQENQAWMDNMEADGEVPRCGGCGRTFERRAALAAHTHTCQPRSRALARRPEAKKIEIQIRKDYNKGPSTITIMKPTGIQEKSGVSAVDDDSQGDVQTNNAMETAEDIETNEINDSNEMDENEKEAEDNAMEIGDDDPKSDDGDEPSELTPDENSEVLDVKPYIHLPNSMQAEKSNLAAFKQRISLHIDFNALLCKKCDTKQKTAAELFDHMAAHFKWKRYACKLCNFKHYEFEKLPEHVKVIHKLKGDSDFYSSTVKAIDGTEAMILSRCLVEAEENEETNEPNESPDSRRPSRCSSDSSRLSDDSSSSTNPKESGTRKRKIHHNKGIFKKKKESHLNDADGDQKNGEVSMDKVLKTELSDNNNSANVKAFEENSSDMEDIEEKITKRHSSSTSIVSRRPIRKKTKPKNEDFEYDLSNLLKMEAQGYRDSQAQQTVGTKANPTKKKTSDIIPQSDNSKPQPDNNKQTDNSKQQFENIKHSYCGALASLSRKAVECAAAHMKAASIALCSIPKERSTNVFARPMLPKVSKISPKKDISTLTDDNKELTNNIKNPRGTESILNAVKDSNGVIEKSREEKAKTDKVKQKTYGKADRSESSSLLCKEPINEQESKKDTCSSIEPTPDNTRLENMKSDLNIPAVLPMKIRRQSLEIMKPIINKNITDFSKAGMKTKILVIKPIKNKDGSRALNTPLKFQKIKLKDSIRGSSNDDQAVLVKVPKVTCTSVSGTTTQTNSTTVTNISNTVEHETDEMEVEEVSSGSTVVSKDIEATLTAVDHAQSQNETKCDDESKVEPDEVTEMTNSIDTTSDAVVVTKITSDLVETVEAPLEELH